MGSISIEHKVGVTILDYWFDRQESFYTSQRLSSLRPLIHHYDQGIKIQCYQSDFDLSMSSP